MSIYIQSASHISFQQPLTEEWMEEPVIPDSTFMQSQEPDYKPFISPMEARRMGTLVKRALATSADALRKGGCEMPDAIISGTGLGCVEHTEKFLNALIDNDEECLPPTSFMQSTHNTISSQIALRLKCHGYNSTYSHRGTSFDSALFDAFMQLSLGKIGTALVGAHDEMTPDYFLMLSKLGYWKSNFYMLEQLRKGEEEGSISGSCSLSMLLSSQKQENTLCELKDMSLFYCPGILQSKHAINEILLRNNLSIKNIDAVVMGLSGDLDNDDVYHELKEHIFQDIPVLWYKQLFGESFGSSSFGVYVGAECLRAGRIPKHLFFNLEEAETFQKEPKNILVYNHFHDRDHSIVLLTK
ncbi:MAG: beta-ketoacyl synthase chain length factor [Bacteroidales bacterium]|nr:beta-ketoacyl synthase chain length factor [Bacteroidales bacterium]